MITTKPILVKFDTEIIATLNEECDKYGKKRNRCINIAVSQWMDRQEAERKAVLDSSRWGSSAEHPKEEHQKYIPTEMEDLGTYYLGNHLMNRLNEISRITAMSRDTLLAMAIDLLIDDYNRRPFAYL